VAMSGTFEPALLKAARLLGAQASLTKPISSEEILRCIEELS